MKRAKISVNGIYAGDLLEIVKGKEYQFTYREKYDGGAVSLTMPVSQNIYIFDRFPPFFEGLLPEGPMLEALLKKKKIDADDYFEQLMQVGKEMVGNISAERAL
jgi:serine/threonine-protein kinase HipA